MKRFLIFMTALLAVLSLVACGEKAAETVEAGPTPETSVQDLTIAATEAPTPEPTATPDPRNQTERLLDAVLVSEPFSYIGMTFSDMDKELGGLDFVNYPMEEECYFQYASLPGCWFLYQSEQYQAWHAAGSTDAEVEAIDVSKASKEMLPDDKVMGAMFMLSDIGMPDELMLSAIDTGIAGEKKTEESGDAYYTFTYKGYSFKVYPDETTFAIDGFSVFLVTAPAA